MNKKRKILTVLALVAFSVIIALHYTPMKYVQLVTPWNVELYSAGGPGHKPYSAPLVFLEDIRLPLFVLAVFYAGLFAILGDNKRRA
jgi:hypothetical protein